MPLDAVFVAPAFVEPAFVAPFDFAAVDEFAEVDDDASPLTTFVTGKPFLSVTTSVTTSPLSSVTASPSEFVTISVTATVCSSLPEVLAALHPAKAVATTVAEMPRQIIFFILFVIFAPPAL